MNKFDKYENRQLGYYSSTLLIVAAMMGTGIFTLTGYLSKNLNTPYLMISAWVIVGVISLCGALTYAEISSAYNDSGGEYLFLSKLIHPSIGFISGWVSFIVGFSAPSAAAAVAFGVYLSSAFGVNISTFLAIFIVILFSFIHIRGVKIGSYLQNILTVLKILLVIIFLIFGMHAYYYLNKIGLDYIYNPNEIFTTNYATSLIFISYAYAGWNMVVYIGGEIKNPERNIPLSLITATLIVSLLYVAINILYINVLSFNEMNNILEIGYVAMNKLYGVSISKYFSIGISLALASMISSLIMTGPRVYMKIGNDYIFLNQLSVKSKYNTPAVSIIFQCCITIIMIITTSYEHLLYYIGFVLSIFTTLTASCIFIVRKKNIKTKFHTPLYPLPPLIFIMFNLAMIFSVMSESPYISLVGIITIIIGYLIYLISSKKTLNIIRY
jgi:basic amino acid/polyamine antiporter, APA family